MRRRARKARTEIPVTYDKRDNGLSNYPAERLNRAARPKSVLSASFFSALFALARARYSSIAYRNSRGNHHAFSITPRLFFRESRFSESVHGKNGFFGFGVVV